MDTYNLYRRIEANIPAEYIAFQEGNKLIRVYDNTGEAFEAKSALLEILNMGSATSIGHGPLYDFEDHRHSTLIKVVSEAIR
jgi:hypothetical protein